MCGGVTDSEAPQCRPRGSFGRQVLTATGIASGACLTARGLPAGGQRPLTAVPTSAEPVTRAGPLVRQPARLRTRGREPPRAPPSPISPPLSSTTRGAWAWGGAGRGGAASGQRPPRVDGGGCRHAATSCDVNVTVTAEAHRLRLTSPVDSVTRKGVVVRGRRGAAPVWEAARLMKPTWGPWWARGAPASVVMGRRGCARHCTAAPPTVTDYNALRVIKSSAAVCPGPQHHQDSRDGRPALLDWFSCRGLLLRCQERWPASFRRG